MNAPPTSSMAKADSRPNGLSHPSRTSSFDSTSSDTAPIMRARSVRFSKTHRYCRRGLCDILHGGRGLRCVEPLPNSLPGLFHSSCSAGKLWPTPLLGRCARAPPSFSPLLEFAKSQTIILRECSRSAECDEGALKKKCGGEQPLRSRRELPPAESCRAEKHERAWTSSSPSLPSPRSSSGAQPAPSPRWLCFLRWSCARG